MSAESFEYDVAFSFLAEDEELATELNDLLSDRLSTFLYSREQGVLAGTDGERTLDRVFGEDSRIVVVLHRENWGSTPWTRIEETAIRNRAYNEGYDFVVFIPLGESASLPEWLPKTRIWVGIERWGLTGAASVVEARVQEQGGSPKAESTVELARRLERDLEGEQSRQSFLRSQAGVDAAREELDTLFGELDRLATEVNDAVSSGGVRTDRDHRGREYLVAVSGLGVTIAWSQQWANSLEHSSLYVRYWDGVISLRGHNFDGEPEQIRERDYDLDRSRSGTVGWRALRGEKRLLSSKELAAEIMKELLDHIRKRELGGD